MTVQNCRRCNTRMRVSSLAVPGRDRTLCSGCGGIGQPIRTHRVIRDAQRPRLKVVPL